MKNKIFLFSVLIASMTLLISSCSKDDSEPSNPTNGKTTAVFNSSLTYGKMTDQDGNVYRTITIGTQTWMAENLRTTKYNDGTSISNTTSSEEWSSLTTGAYCNYNNTTNLDTIATYGRLYNWYAVNTSKLAPKGWHVPTDAEWKILETYLGLPQSSLDSIGKWRGTDQGGKIKEIGTTHWNTSNTEITNSTGFTSLPSGNWDSTTTSHFGYIGDACCYWSSTEYNSNSALYRALFSLQGNKIYRNAYTNNKISGMSVRCIKD